MVAYSGAGGIFPGRIRTGVLVRQSGGLFGVRTPSVIAAVSVDGNGVEPAGPMARGIPALAEAAGRAVVAVKMSAVAPAAERTGMRALDRFLRMRLAA